MKTPVFVFFACILTFMIAIVPAMAGTGGSSDISSAGQSLISRTGGSSLHQSSAASASVLVQAASREVAAGSSLQLIRRTAQGFSPVTGNHTSFFSSGTAAVYPQIMTRVFSSNDNGKEFILTSGHVVRIELDENPTTGYLWDYQVSKGIHVVSDTFTPSASGRFGAGGTRVWELRMEEKGIQMFNASYRRPWEPVTDADSTFSVSFVVK
jgi:inhibitor of cysteine peptidase